MWLYVWSRWASGRVVEVSVWWCSRGGRVVVWSRLAGGRVVEECDWRCCVEVIV